MTFMIQPAVRKGTPALISLWGPSGSGKTYSALLLARGLVGPKGKIALIDTENRRAEFYAELADGWDHLDFQPPYTPERYTAALKATEDESGYGCVIVDSGSHVWEGEGGVLDMADAGRTQQGKALTGLKKWQAPKMAYKRYLNHLLRAPFHVIICLRAKDKVEQRGGEVYSDGSLVPIIDKRFVYEMTVNVELGIEHQPKIDTMKCPEELLGAFPARQKINLDTGRSIADWVGAGASWDADLAQLEKEARDKSTLGTEQMRAYWSDLGKDTQQRLKPILQELQHIAAQADQNGPNGHEDTEEDLSEAFKPGPATAPTEGDPLDGGLEDKAPAPEGTNSEAETAEDVETVEESGGAEVDSEEPFCRAYGEQPEDGDRPAIPCADATYFLDTLGNFLDCDIDKLDIWKANKEGRDAVAENGTPADMNRLDELQKAAYGADA